jgi:hypothetical protein
VRLPKFCRWEVYLGDWRDQLSRNVASSLVLRNLPTMAVRTVIGTMPLENVGQSGAAKLTLKIGLSRLDSECPEIRWQFDTEKYTEHTGAVQVRNVGVAKPRWTAKVQECRRQLDAEHTGAVRPKRMSARGKLSCKIGAIGATI